MRLVNVLPARVRFSPMRTRISSKIVHLALHRANFNLRIDQPVGRIICSTTTPPDLVSSYGPGVAET